MLVYIFPPGATIVTVVMLGCVRTDLSCLNTSLYFNIIFLKSHVTFSGKVGRYLQPRAKLRIWTHTRVPGPSFLFCAVVFLGLIGYVSLSVDSWFAPRLESLRRIPDKMPIGVIWQEGSDGLPWRFWECPNFIKKTQEAERNCTSLWQQCPE